MTDRDDVASRDRERGLPAVGRSGRWTHLAGTMRDGRRTTAISVSGSLSPVWFMLQHVERAPLLTARAWDGRWAFHAETVLALDLEIGDRRWSVPEAKAAGQELRWVTGVEAMEAWVSVLPAEGQMRLMIRDDKAPTPWVVSLDGSDRAAAWMAERMQSQPGGSRRGRSPR